MLYDSVIAPFVEFEFMRRALVGAFALALGAGPVGVFLMLRRMSLMGDAMSHAILPGAAIGFLLSGLSLFAMTAGGLIAGFVVAALHDIELVRANFPDVLLLAREPVAWGAAAEVLTPDNLLKARRMCEAFDEAAVECVA